VERLNAFQPQALYGYPSIVAVLAVEQQAGRLRIGPESVFTSSEPLSPTVRERLEQAFAVRPHHFYATTEGLYGHECAEGSMHLFDDMCIAENVDEDYRRVPPGEVGSRLLVTNLFNLTQPLIRFEVTDLVAVEPEPWLRARVGARLEELGVPRPSVVVETVDALERSPAGKLQVVVAGSRS
jgi:phenylacetate-CoA ligase